MIVDLGILVFSVMLLALTGQFYTTRVVYKNKEDVKAFIGFLNKYIANNYYAPDVLEKQINSILVSPQKDYCILSDVHKYYHPDTIMKDTHTFREYKGVIKTALQQNFYDVLPNVNLYRRNQEIPPRYKLPLQLTLPFTYYDQLIRSFKVGQQSVCLFQKYNHLLQRASLSHKNLLLTNQIAYLNNLKQKGVDQDCIKNATFLPKSYRLFEEDECKEFFAYLASEEYQQKVEKHGPQFILKLGKEIHRGRGITMLFPQQTEELKIRFRDGENCGINTIRVAQQYIGNPLLYKGHKIEFRVYWILASTNPVIAYAYERTLIRRCIYPFDKFSLEKEVHVCNTAIVKNTLEKLKNEKNSEDGDDDDETDKDQNNDQYSQADEDLYIDWKLDYLQDLLYQQGKIKTKDWLKKQLEPKVDRMIIHAIKSTQYTFANDSKLGEFFAADFLLTDDLDLHIMEINYNPQTLNTTQNRIDQHTKMVVDMIEIQNAYLRSRYLRIKKIIDRTLKQLQIGKVRLLDLVNPKLTQEIDKAYVDRLDQNINISSNNLFRLIMDENLGGTKQYKDLIQEKCLV